MPNYKITDNVLSLLDENDKKSLLSVYLHRCLSEDLLEKYFFGENTKKHIKKLVNMRILFATEYKNGNLAYFLDTRGVNVVTKIYGGKLKKMYKPTKDEIQLPKSKSLRMKPVNIPHQMHLNAFGLEFESYARGLIGYKYYDEKFMPPASNFMMPDGMIELPHCYVFLEMDMGTESGSRLRQKWDSYRTFLNGTGEFYRRKPIVMLFLIDGVTKNHVRTKTVMINIAKNLLDKVGRNFEIYVDTPARCHELLRNKIVKLNDCTMRDERKLFDIFVTPHGFMPTNSTILNRMSLKPDLYIRRLSEDQNIQITHGTPQEFLVDIWTDNRMSVLRKIKEYERMRGQIQKLTNRFIPYLIVVPSELWVYKLMKALGLYQEKTIFFTTEERLCSLPWNQALFYIDPLGNLECFLDESYTMTKHERRLRI